MIGAKGILALDPELPGEMLCLRKCQTKFPGSKDSTLEICGASYKRLPFYLNRQLIKILEDLGTPPSAFLDLQHRAINTLKHVTTHPINAARFLETNLIGVAARMPMLIRSLNAIGMNFREDRFLRDVVELAALIGVRTIKYRARILVEKGFTLYGTIDETGYLKEGEVYVPTRNNADGKFELMLGLCLVTRSPALHPGDVQIAKAVNVPEDSPLRELTNCVVFSQHGARDLPSMLSGGDLDGDTYNVIFDHSLWPTHTHNPAEYPRVAAVDIGRTVEIHDMTNFFLDFMRTDRLGYISNLHLQAADQLPNGVKSDACLKLAEMASTAVDFSKTGVPVSQNSLLLWDHTS